MKKTVPGPLKNQQEKEFLNPRETYRHTYSKFSRNFGSFMNALI